MGSKTIKTIEIDTGKCTGCRSCEVICTAFHSESALTNRERSRIRVFIDEENDVYVPILAGPYAKAECIGRNKIVIHGKEYDECFFCRASCPSRDFFKEPDSGIPLKCDMCGEPPQPEPLCVKWCQNDALTYIEREVEIEEAEKGVDTKAAAIEYLITKYGLKEIQKVLERKQKT